MNCPTCTSAYGPDDRFCGHCGERLPRGDAAPGVGPGNGATPGRDDTAGLVAVAMPPTDAPANACPVCGAARAESMVTCLVCGYEPESPATDERDATPVVSATPVLGGAHAGGPPLTLCPVHGPLESSWTRCPQCLRDGRDGRLEPTSAAGSASAAVIDGPPPPAAVPAALRGERGARPPSSVGLTFVIGRRPQLLAYVIETAGDTVGRVYQLRDDATDIGRDPRNTIVLDDGLVSGFHARIERDGDGGVVIEDLGSTNGTRINGEALTGSRPLVENDEIQIGGTQVVLKLVHARASQP